MSRSRLSHLILLPLLALLLSGCFLRVMLPSVVVEELGDQIDLVFASVATDATLAVCLDNEFFNDVEIECIYVIDGVRYDSTAELLLEKGIAGWIIDPLILQIPDGATVIGANVDDGSGPQPLRVTSDLTSLPIQPGKDLVAEAGQQLVLLELPAALESRLPTGDPAAGLDLTFGLGMQRRVDPGEARSISVKAIAAGRVELDGQFYYIPLFPCATDFAGLPAVELSPTSTDLLPVLASLLTQSDNPTCDGERTQYNFGPPRPHMLYLPAAHATRSGRSLSR